MIRRRPNSTTPQANGNGHHDESKLGKSLVITADPTFKPILPHWLVGLIVIFFVAAGFTQDYYSKSRNALALHPTTTSSNSETTRVDIQSLLLTPQQDKDLEMDPNTGLRHHLVFSTDCSPYQHWQSYLVYFTALKVRQPGHVTRIASGCDEQQAAEMQAWFDKDVQFMSTRFHLQLTPHFSQIKDSSGNTVGDYKFFNKPFGLKYWMEHSPQLGYKDGTFDASLDKDVVILIDPDMGLLRPLTADFSKDRETVIAKPRQEHILARTVGPGKPFAQVYGFGTQWQRLDLEKIAGPNTPASVVSKLDGRLYYPVGPPYLATVPDMYKIAVSWSSFVPAVYEQYPHLLAEMFAYCIAAAHLELPHQLIDSLMISQVHPGASTGGEGWALVDAIPPQDTCRFAKNIQHDLHAVPSVVHLCQRYIVGSDWFFSKRKVPADIYDCNVPLFAEPPDDLATRYNYKQAPVGGKRQDLSPVEAARSSFMLCYLHSIMNQAATFYKKHACQGQTMNLNKTRRLVDLFNVNKDTKQS